MLDLIYKETRATKSNPSVRYVYGFTRSPGVANRDELARMTSIASAPSVYTPKAVKEAKAYLDLFKPVTVKGAAVLAVLQGAHKVSLSKGERAHLLREMRILAENAGFSAEELLKAA